MSTDITRCRLPCFSLSGFLVVGVSRRRGFSSSGFLVVGIGVMIKMTMMGLDRDHFFFYDEPRSSWSPTFDLPALFLGFTSLECAALVWLTLRFSGLALSKAAIIGLIAFAPRAMIHTLKVMHAPGFMLMHALWSTAVRIVLAALRVANPIARLMVLHPACKSGMAGNVCDHESAGLKFHVSIRLIISFIRCRRTSQLASSSYSQDRNLRNNRRKNTL